MRQTPQATLKEERSRSMHNLPHLKLLLLVVLTLGLAAIAISCGGSKANVRTEEATKTPAGVDVTTAAAIRRELPRFVEATGSLAGDEQTDVAPQIAGKVVGVGVDRGSY